MKILNKSLFFISLTLAFSCYQSFASDAETFREKVSKTTCTVKKYINACNEYVNALPDTVQTAAFIIAHTGCTYLWFYGLGAFNERDTIQTKFLWSFFATLALMGLMI